MIIALDIFIALTAIMGWLWYMKWKYAHDLKPTKKYPQGKIIAEFWQETGTRRRELRGITNDGQGILEADNQQPAMATSKSKLKEDSYRFAKRHVGRTKYPVDPILNLTILQADAAIVSWAEGITEPIDPWRNREDALKNPFMNRKYVAGLRDQDRLTSNIGISEEIEQASGLKQGALDKRLVYIMLIVSIVAAAGAAMFAYQGYKILSVQFGG